MSAFAEDRWNRSALVVWSNGRKEWLPLTDVDKESSFYRAIRQGFIREVETIEHGVRSGRAD